MPETPTNTGPHDPVGATAPKDAGFQNRITRELRRALVDPSTKSDEPDIVNRRSDRVAAFGPVIMAMRLATTAVTLLLVAPDIMRGDTTIIITTLVVTIYALIRTFHPIKYTNDVSSIIQVVAEVAIHVAAINLTGYWNSPLIFSLITSVCIAGFARGFGFALRIGVAVDLAVSLPRCCSRTPTLPT